MQKAGSLEKTWMLEKIEGRFFTLLFHFHQEAL